jgi:TatD DNase family protein
MLIDAHCHLQAPELALWREGAWASCGDMGWLVNGTGADDWEAVQALEAPEGSALWTAYGLHPWKAGDAEADWHRKLQSFLEKDPRCVSVGEIGLDRWIEPRNESLQLTHFTRQLRLARELALPPTLHCLRAWGLLVDTLKKEGPWPGGFLVHAFSGSVEILHQLIDLGAYFSFSAYGADPARKRIRDALRACPEERLLLETDAPDMVPPRDLCQFSDLAEGGVQDPREVKTAAVFVATVRETSSEAVARVTEANFRRLFLRR